MSADSTPGPAGADHLADGWVVWNDEVGGPATWVFDPETFDAERFPAACLPTIQISTRHSERRPPRETDGTWRARLTLEPGVELDRSSACPTRSMALDRGRSLAQEFAAGAYDLTGAYQDASDREAYLAALSASIADLDGSTS